jgi:uncharacterized repeat protein (TIGR03803 family)
MRCRTISVGLTCLILAMLATGAWAAPKYKVLYTFTGSPDGGAPSSPLIFDNSGNLYGTTYLGGQAGCFAGYGCGTVFELTPVAGGGWSAKVLYAFTGAADGGNPIYGGLTFDAAGNLYGTTNYGGMFGGACEPYGCGTIFEVAPDSQEWTESVLYSFTGTSGQQPASAVAFDLAGRLYNTTLDGGQYGSGTIVELVKGRSGDWKQTTLHQFTGGADGADPVAGLIADAAGNFYGTTPLGGIGAPNGGTVFELTASGTVKTLHSFKCGLNKCNSKDAGNPWSGLVFDKQGNLYGAATRGGTHQKNGTEMGAVYKLAPSKSGSWRESVIYSFGGGREDGAEPFGSLVFDKDGNLDGTTNQGGINHNGVVFKLSPRSGGEWKETILHRFTGGSDGGHPFGGLVLDGDGNLCGTTFFGGAAGCGEYGTGCGVVFELTP